MKKFILASLLGGLLACAPAHYSAYTFDNALAMFENAGLVSPEFPDIKGDSHARFVPLLTTVIEKKHGLRVLFTVFEGDSSDLWGYYTGDTILIATSLSPNAKVATLIHELGHHLEPTALSGKREGQIFAEAFSVIVCRELGLDIQPSSFGYLQQFDNRHEIATRYARELDAAAGALLKELR